MQQIIDNFYFHKDVSSPTSGLEYRVTNASCINIEFETSGTFSAMIEVKINVKSNTWKSIMAIDLTTSDLVSSITDATHVYQIETVGFSMVRVNLTAVSGNISVYGKVVG